MTKMSCADHVSGAGDLLLNLGSSGDRGTMQTGGECGIRFTVSSSSLSPGTCSSSCYEGLRMGSRSCSPGDPQESGAGTVSQTQPGVGPAAKEHRCQRRVSGTGSIASVKKEYPSLENTEIIRLQQHGQMHAFLLESGLLKLNVVKAKLACSNVQFFIGGMWVNVHSDETGHVPIKFAHNTFLHVRGDNSGPPPQATPSVGVPPPQTSALSGGGGPVLGRGSQDVLMGPPPPLSASLLGSSGPSSSSGGSSGGGGGSHGPGVIGSGLPNGGGGGSAGGTSYTSYSAVAGGAVGGGGSGGSSYGTQPAIGGFYTRDSSNGGPAYKDYKPF